jgi:hypothetical protein
MVTESAVGVFAEFIEARKLIEIVKGRKKRTES